MTNYGFSHWIAGSSQVISLGEKEAVGVVRKLTPGALLTFFLTFPCTGVSWKVPDILPS